MGLLNFYLQEENEDDEDQTGEDDEEDDPDYKPSEASIKYLDIL